MKLISFVILFLIACIGLNRLSPVTHAQNNETLFTNPTDRPVINLPNPIGAFGDNSDLNSFFTFIVEFLLSIGGIIAFIFALYGGFRYITAAGNPQMMESGKRMLIGSIVGVLIMALAFLVVRFAVTEIQGFLGG